MSIVFYDDLEKENKLLVKVRYLYYIILIIFAIIRLFNKNY